MDLENRSEAEADFVDRVYAVAMEPERYVELLHAWHARLENSTGNEFQNLEGLIPHLDNHLFRADTLLSSVGTGTNAVPTRLRDYLDRDTQATVAVDANGAIQGLNHAARISFSVGDGDSLSDLPFDDIDIQDLSKEITLMLAPDPSAASPKLFRFTILGTQRQIFLALTTFSPISGRPLVLIKSADFIWPAELDDLVKNAFGLTQAELEVVRQLCEGASIQSIAEERGVGTKTVRAQLTSIYEKTDTKNQTELVRLALGLCRLNLIAEKASGDAVKPSNSGVISPPFPHEEHRNLVTLPDGRVMEYADFGDPQGTPVLHLHCEVFGDAWSARMVADATERGFRIISPARPGHGRSTQLSKRQNGPETHSQDLIWLLDRLGIDKAIHVYQMAGGNFSLQHHHDAPDRVLGVVVVGQLFPFDAGIEGLRPPYMQRLLASAITSSDKVLGFLTRGGAAYLNRVGPKRFFQMLISESDTDFKTLETPEFMQTMAHGINSAAAQGHLGYYSDYRDIVADPMGKLLAIDAPVRVMIAGQAKAEEAANLRHAIDRKPNFKEKFLEDAGTFLFFSHHADVVDSIEEVVKAANAKGKSGN